MSDNLYGALGASEPGFGDQMDPLGTANQHAFGQPAPSTEPAAGFGAAPASATIGATPAVKIGKVKTKKPLSTGKKVLYGAGGILFVFFALIVVLDPGPQKINASPTPPANPPAAAEQMGAPGSSGDTATLMGGSPAPAPAAAIADTQPPVGQAPGAAPATTQAPASAPAAAAVPSQTAPSPAPAPAAVAAAAPAAQTVEPKPVVAPPAKLVMVKEKAPAIKASPEELAYRLATLEKRLARYEREVARERVQAAQTRVAPAQARVAPPAPAPAANSAATYRPVSASSAVETRRPAVLSNDSVRVIGVSTRHGITTALVEFGGVKHRVAAGEAIPGLGMVGSVAVDAAGNPVVEVNGVRYQ